MNSLTPQQLPESSLRPRAVNLGHTDSRDDEGYKLTIPPRLHAAPQLVKYIRSTAIETLRSLGIDEVGTSEEIIIPHDQVDDFVRKANEKVDENRGFVFAVDGARKSVEATHNGEPKGDDYEQNMYH